MLSRVWKHVGGFDLDFRPRTYFLPQGVPEGVGALPRGTFRRRLLAGEDLPPGAADILADELLPPHLRDQLGRLHPSLMGGEYLPRRAALEVEIARIELASVTGDVIEVRARRTPKGMKYRLVDEYETAYAVRPRFSAAPLTLLGLIRLIETARPHSPTVDALRLNLAGGAEWQGLHRFVTVSSPFYPQLGAWYEAYLGRWLASRRRRGSVECR